MFDRADLRKKPRAGPREARIDVMDGRCIASAGHGLRGGHQGHHLRVEKLLQRAIRLPLEAAVQYVHHHAEKQRERYRHRNQQSAA